jgi:hypothetical protein
VIARHDYGAGSSYCGGVIDIEALRDFRARSPLMNWMKDLRTEMYALIYQQALYPKNLWLRRKPMRHAEYQEKVIGPAVQRMYKLGVWTPPSHAALPARAPAKKSLRSRKRS